MGYESDFPPASVAGRGTPGKGGLRLQPRWLGHRFPVSLFLGTTSTLNGDTPNLNKRCPGQTAVPGFTGLGVKCHGRHNF